MTEKNRFYVLGPSQAHVAQKRTIVPKKIVIGSKDNRFFHLSNNKNLGKTVWMQRSTQRANNTDRFLLPDL